MKKLILIIAGLMTLSAQAMTEKAQKEVEKALSGDYDTLRNVAYSMKTGSFGHDLNPVAGCALRKVILLTQSDKTHSGDYGNEYVDCKALSPADSEAAWKLTLQMVLGK
jgi:hypothetical protein|nr:MAG TPA: hypothetical protein [Caudoviricetes sp.]